MITTVEENGKWFAYCHHYAHQIAFVKSNTREKALELLAEELFKKLTAIYDKVTEFSV